MAEHLDDLTGWQMFLRKINPCKVDCWPWLEWIYPTFIQWMTKGTDCVCCHYLRFELRGFILGVIVMLVLSGCSVPQRGFIDGGYIGATDSSTPVGEEDKGQVSIGVYYGFAVTPDVELYLGCTHRSNPYKTDDLRGSYIDGCGGGAQGTFYRRD